MINNGESERQSEQPLFTRLASRQRGRLTHGGRLIVTRTHLLFRPSWIERELFRVGAFSTTWSEVSEISVVARDMRLSSLPAGVRRRLQVTLHDGRREVFIVNQVDAVVQKLHEIERSQSLSN